MIRNNTQPAARSRINAVIHRNKAFWVGMDIIYTGCGIDLPATIKAIGTLDQWGNRMALLQPATGFAIWRSLSSCKPAARQWGTILSPQTFDDVVIVDLLGETYYGVVVDAYRSGAIVVRVDDDDEPLICNAAFVTEIRRAV